MSAGVERSLDYESAKAKMDSVIDDADEVRAVIHTQPKLTGIGKKVPDILEIKIGCSTPKAGYVRILELFGQEVLPENVFKAGDVVDAISITKGKGFQGPVKRWGIRILARKARKSRRGSY